MKKPTNYEFFTSKEIKPTGWMLRQLRLQAEGLSGNLHKVWPDVRDSAWIGGDCEGWERVPYWLDGFVPLAYLLEDEELITVAKRYINAILDRQRPDGWICPCEDDARQNYDIWAVFLICKTLLVYYDCSGDSRAWDAVYHATLNLKESLDNGTVKVAVWGYARWFEMFITLCDLYEKTGEEWILELGRTLKEQGLDYEAHQKQWTYIDCKWTFETHIVNIGMMFKFEALCCRLFGEEYTDKAERIYKLIKKYSGTAVGTFTGDECLSGHSPIQGTELCGVVELMYSFEHLYGFTGDTKWLDRLEQVAFNSLPATLSDDMWTHQYDQQVNQVSCIRIPGRPIFRSNGVDAHLFGLDPNYGCCTANFNQGWPKLALSAFYKSSKGIVCGTRVPSVLSTEIDGVPVKIELVTEYPFRHRLCYKITAEKPVSFEFKMPIPAWAERTTVNGEQVHGKSFAVTKKWQNDTLEVEFFDTPKALPLPEGLFTVKYGALHFSLPIKTRFEKHDREDCGFLRTYPYCDYHLIPESDWNYALSGERFEVVELPGDDIPFSSKSPRIALRTDMAKINWDHEEGYPDFCRRTPRSKRALSASEQKLLHPYGCAKLRITAMPKAK